MRPWLLWLHETDMSTTMHDALRAHGWDVVWACTDREAKHALGQSPPSAIVLNLGLRTLNAVAFATQVKWDPLTCPIPIVVFHSTEPSPIHQAAWATEVLPWPFDVEQLCATLETCRGHATRHHPHILVVDDEPDVVEVMSRTLQAQGFRVAGAFDGLQALELARSIHPDVMLLDLEIPRLNGWQVLAQLKRDGHLSTMRVVIFTGVATHPEDQAAGLSQGADAYLVKPCSTDEVVRTVQGVL